MKTANRKKKLTEQAPTEPEAGVEEQLSDAEFAARYGYTKEEAAEMSYVGKLLDARETEEERIVIQDYFAG